MVSFIRADLDFILQQILIAEAHADGSDLSALLPNVQVPFGLRTVDGSFNNLVISQDAFGAADTTFPRLTTPIFRTAEPSPGGTPTSYTQTSGLVFDSQPRTISNLIVDQTMNNPAAIAAALLLAGSQDVEGDTATVQAAFQAIAAATTPAAKAQAQADFDALTAQLNLSVVTSPGLDGQFGTADDRQVFSDRQRDARRRSWRAVQLVDDVLRPVLRPRPRPRHQGRHRHHLHPAAAGRPARTAPAARCPQLHGADAGHQPARPGRRPRHRRRHPRAREHHLAVRRPEPDLLLAPLASGVPARL